jgi:Flp pilus assembly protein TadB
MSGTSSSSPAWLLAASRRRTSYSGLRISDAERADVADLLSKHYGDGRLDQAEFNERLDQAMKAKTYADLDGILADLPRTDAEAAEAPKATARRRHERPYLRVLLLTVVIVIGVAAAAHALAWSFGTWVVLGLLGALLYATQVRRR